MDVINCKSCGRLFNALDRSRLCPACKRALEDKFQEVKQYLRDNPNATVNQTAEDNDVTIKQIKQWIREERLVLTNPAGCDIRCEQCGAAITTGRFCEKCKANMTNDLQQAFGKPKGVLRQPEKNTHEKDRMRFLQS